MAAFTPSALHCPPPYSSTLWKSVLASSHKSGLGSTAATCKANAVVSGVPRMGVCRAPKAAPVQPSRVPLKRAPNERDEDSF